MKQKQKDALISITGAIVLLLIGLGLVWIGADWKAAVGVLLALAATNHIRTKADDLL